MENTFLSLLELSIDSPSPWLRSWAKYLDLLPHSVCTTGQGGSCPHYHYVIGEESKLLGAEEPGLG